MTNIWWIIWIKDLVILLQLYSPNSKFPTIIFTHIIAKSSRWNVKVSCQNWSKLVKIGLNLFTLVKNHLPNSEFTTIIFTHIIAKSSRWNVNISNRLGPILFLFFISIILKNWEEKSFLGHENIFDVLLRMNKKWVSLFLAL